MPKPTLRALFASSLFLATTLAPLVMLDGASATPTVPALETLANPSLEGEATAGNGFTLLHDGAQLSAFPRSGAQSVDLARSGATPSGLSLLGGVEARTTHAVLLTQLATVSYHLSVATEPAATVHLRLSLPLDTDADDVPDRCLVRHEAPPTPAAGWQAMQHDGSSLWTVMDDGSCALPDSDRTLASIRSDPAFVDATLRALRIETIVSSPDPWMGPPVHVDDLGLRATSSPLIRIQAATDNLCGGASFASLPLAMDCAASGATLLLGAGTFQGGIAITKPLTLCGVTHMAPACDAGSAAAVIRGGGENVLTLAADDITLRNLSLLNPDYTTTGDRSPALVVVLGDRTRLEELDLSRAAAPPGVNQWRVTTEAISIRGDAADTVIEGIHVHDMPTSRGVAALCARPPCSTKGVSSSNPGHGLSVLNSTFDMAGAHPSIAILARDHGARFEGNDILVSGSSTSAEPRSVGIATIGSPHSWSVRENAIRPATGEPQRAATGIQGQFVGLVAEGNVLRGLRTAIHLDAGGATADSLVVGNLIEQNAEGILNEAPRTEISANSFRNNDVAIVAAGDGADRGDSTDLRIHNDTIVAASGLALRVLAEVPPSTLIDARFTAWGAHSASGIRARIDDQRETDNVDIRCFLDSDGLTHVCPPVADFQWSPIEPHWGRDVQFLNTSVATARPITTFRWDFGDGASSTARDPSTAFAAPGARSVTLTVTDAEGFSDSVTKTVSVANTAPVIEPQPSRMVGEGETLSFRLVASDPDGDPLVHGATNLPPGAQFWPGNATFRWQPDFTQEGAYGDVTFHATDGFANASLTVPITVARRNAPPTVAVDGPLTVKENELLTIRVAGADVDGDALTMRAFPMRSGMSFVDHRNGTGTFTWTPHYLQSGTYSLAFQASDGANYTPLWVNLTVLNNNRPPAFEAVTPKTLHEGELVAFIVSATDPDGDALSYWLDQKPAYAEWDQGNRAFRWTPTLSQAGTYVLPFRVSDNLSFGYLNVTLTVLDTNQPPVLAPIPNVTAKANRTLVVPLSANDPERQAITYSAPGAPAGIVFEGASLRWRPSPTQAGPHDVTVVATDPSGGSDSRTFRIIVEENLPPVVLATIPDITVHALATFNAAASHDPDANGTSTLTYVWDFDATDGISNDKTGVAPNWTYARPGHYNITVRVTDGDGMSTTRIIPIVVDDRIYVTATVASNSDFTRANYAYATLTTWDGKPIANTKLDVWVTYAAAGNPVRPETWRGRVTTDESGYALFVLPRELVLLTAPGTHHLHVQARVPNTFLGDVEEATAVAPFGTLIV